MISGEKSEIFQVLFDEKIKRARDMIGMKKEGKLKNCNKSFGFSNVKSQRKFIMIFFISC